MYITAEAVDETLSFVVINSVAGSSIVFNYMFESAVGRESQHEGVREVHDMLERWGESHVFGIDPERIVEFLRERGFGEVENPSNESLEEKYFKPAGRDEKIVPYIGIVRATTANPNP